MRENGPAGKPQVVVTPLEACVNWPRYWISWLKISIPAVRGRGDRPVEQERLREADLIVLRAVALLRRHAEGLAAAEEVRRLERELPEEPLVLRHARAEGDLVAVLLFDLQPD